MCRKLEDQFTGDYGVIIWNSSVPVQFKNVYDLPLTGLINQGRSLLLYYNYKGGACIVAKAFLWIQ